MKFPFYTLAYAGWALGATPFYLIRGLRTGKYLWNASDRLGLNRPVLPPKSGPRIWVHALSLGEVISSVELVRRLTGKGLDVCLSTTTLSGFQAAREKVPPSVPHLCFPLDWPPAIRRLLDAVRPDLFVLVETDIWPNFLAELNHRRIPSVLVNARVSPRSLSGYRLLQPFWGRVLRLIDVIACQTDEDRGRMIALGAAPDRAVVSGNLKYDRPDPDTGGPSGAELLKESGLPSGLWLAGGSTHVGEDEALLDMFIRLRADCPTLRLLLAPRRRERFEAVWRAVQERGLRGGRRSAGRPDTDVEVFLLDTQGELDRFYELADIVFVGKSLPGADEGGGHNLLEPAARSKPVLFGPLMQNFNEIAQLMSSGGGGLQVADAAGLEAAVMDLLHDADRRQRMGRRARSVFETHRGAMDRTINLIHTVLDGGKAV